MNPRVAYIAFNTFREAVRDRVLYNLIAFALLLSGAAILVGEISIDIERLVVVNLGLTADWFRKRSTNERSTRFCHVRFADGSSWSASFSDSRGRWWSTRSSWR